VRLTLVVHLEVLDAVRCAVDVQVHLKVDEVVADVADRMRVDLQGGPKKTDTQFYFCDNFGNSAPILTILLLLEAEIYGAQTLSSSTYRTFIV